MRPADAAEVRLPVNAVVRVTTEDSTGFVAGALLVADLVASGFAARGAVDFPFVTVVPAPAFGLSALGLLVSCFGVALSRRMVCRTEVVTCRTGLVARWTALLARWTGFVTRCTGFVTRCTGLLTRCTTLRAFVAGDFVTDDVVFRTDSATLSAVLPRSRGESACAAPVLSTRPRATPAAIISRREIQARRGAAAPAVVTVGRFSSPPRRRASMGRQ